MQLGTTCPCVYPMWRRQTSSRRGIVFSTRSARARSGGGDRSRLVRATGSSARRASASTSARGFGGLLQPSRPRADRACAIRWGVCESRAYRPCTRAALSLAHTRPPAGIGRTQPAAGRARAGSPARRVRHRRWHGGWCAGRRRSRLCRGAGRRARRSARDRDCVARFERRPATCARVAARRRNLRILLLAARVVAREVPQGGPASAQPPAQLGRPARARCPL